jgi:hypothetical protein
MKHIIKLAFMLSVLLVSQIASAFCTTDLGSLPRNHAPFFASSNGGFCDTKAEANVQVVSGFQQFQQVIVPAPTVINTMPAGYGYRNCTAEESIRRAGLITAGGGLVGLLLRDNGRAAGTGAGLGLLYAMGTDCKVAVPQGVPPARVLGSSQTGGVTTQVLSSCQTEGWPNMRGLTPDECARVVAKLTGVTSPVPAQTPAQVSQPVSPFGNGYDGPPTNVGGHTCSVVTKDGRVLADFLDATKNPKGIVVTSGAACSSEKASFAQK